MKTKYNHNFHLGNKKCAFTSTTLAFFSVADAKQSKDAWNLEPRCFRSGTGSRKTRIFFLPPFSFRVMNGVKRSETRARVSFAAAGDAI